MPPNTTIVVSADGFEYSLVFNHQYRPDFGFCTRTTRLAPWSAGSRRQWVVDSLRLRFALSGRRIEILPGTG